MKLAEALQERADLKIKLSSLCTRINNNCLYQEGEKPAENPAKLLGEYNACCERLEYLIKKINLTNSKTEVDGRTLTEIIAEKDVLTLRLSFLRELVNSASSGAQRARRTEIKLLSAVDAASLQKQADELAKQRRLLDNLIQATNWSADLIE